MAHLPNDALPSEFDVVVQGTGLIESILAAALARCEKRILHLDRNGFYGEMWASLMPKEFDEWLHRVECSDEPVNREDVVQLPATESSYGFSNFCQTVHENQNTDQISTASESLSWNSLEKLKRRLVYDICPKLLACRGMMVDLLTKSGCSRYVEFKAVTKICIYESGKVQQVPCSRADVFESKLVSMLEKRKMMKFLAFCTNFETDTESTDLENVTFIEYLRTKDLTENLIHYILLCIAMRDGCVTALEGLQASKLFLKSLGRFDNAPFLYPIFGGGEIPQAFCRYCAVFGGVYCLRCSIKAFLLSNSNPNTISSIITSNGQEITCKAVVCNVSLVKNMVNVGSVCTCSRMSRAILLVDGPLENSEGKQTLLTLPPHTVETDQNQVIRALQLDPSTKTAVDGTFMVHLMCESVGHNAKTDLEGAVRLLFNVQDDCLDHNKSRPRVLWSLYFNMDTHTIKESNLLVGQWATNLYPTSNQDSTMTYEKAVQEAEKIFRSLCPGEQFFEPSQDIDIA